MLPKGWLALACLYEKAEVTKKLARYEKAESDQMCYEKAGWRSRFLFSKGQTGSLEATQNGEMMWGGGPLNTKST